MGWGKNQDVDTTRKRKTGPKRIALSSIHGGHSPDRHGRKKGAPGMFSPPIEVERSGFGYRLVDGVNRVSQARAAGQYSIRAYVWQ